MTYKNFFVLFCGCFLSLGAIAQNHEVGFGAGVANYRGDMSPIINITQPGVHGTLFYRYNPNAVWGFRVNASLAQIRHNDKGVDDLVAGVRNHSFLTGILELSGQVEYNFLNFGKGTPRNPQRFSPYALLGFGMFQLEPIRNSTPVYATWSRCVPMGLGVKYLISRNVQCNIEFGARFTSTDYLDDLGQNTGSPTNTTNPKLQGNPNTKDMYFFSHVSFSYVIRNKKDICPIQF